MSEFRGIDVSHWQGDIDWAKVKAAGIQFAIIKAGGSDAGFYTDPRWEENYREAKANGIAVGAYYFVGPACTSAEDGKADAQRFLAQLSGKQLEYPVFMDNEAQPVSAKAGITEATIAFCRALEAAGYFAGIYGSTYSGFRDRMEDSRLTSFTHWVAQYASKCTYGGAYGIWQYSSSGRISGINGNVDLDISYQDYPSVITAGGFNGYGKGSKPVQITPAPSPAPSQPESSGFAVGDVVQVTNAVTYDGVPFKLWYNEYSVMEVSGDRVVIGIGGQVTAAVNAANLTKVSGGGNAPSSGDNLSVGDQVKVIHPVTYDGRRFTVWYDTYTVMEITGDRVVIGVNGTVTAAVKRSSIKKV